MRYVALGLAALTGFGLAGIAYFEPALAAPIRGAPGPLIGVGLPLAGAVVATVLIVRRLRQKP